MIENKIFENNIGMSGGRQEITLNITNLRGLHARASAKFVKCAENFPNADITVSKDGSTVSALSIMGLMALAAGCGSAVTVSAPDTEEGVAALAALKSLTEGKFGEE